MRPPGVEIHAAFLIHQGLQQPHFRVAELDGQSWRTHELPFFSLTLLPQPARSQPLTLSHPRTPQKTSAPPPYPALASCPAERSAVLYICPARSHSSAALPEAWSAMVPHRMPESSALRWQNPRSAPPAFLGVRPPESGCVGCV